MGGVDILLCKIHLLVSASGVMISLLSGFHRNFSLLLYCTDVRLSVTALRDSPLGVKKGEMSEWFGLLKYAVCIPSVCIRTAMRPLLIVFDWMPGNPLAAVVKH